MRVCRKKKGRGVATCYTFSRGGATVERRWFPQRRNFSTRAPKWPSRGMGREILVFLSPFFFFWLRFAFFGRANVILIARLSALLCEFARHFFISFPREIADAEEGETSSRFLAPLACEFVRRNENFPFPPLPICSPFVRALIPRCLLYRRRLFLAREGFVSLSVHTGRKWTSGSFLATMCIPQLDIYYTRVYSRLLV